MTSDLYPPLAAPLTLGARQLIARSGLYSRRELRKIRSRITFEDGRSYGLKDKVTLRGDLEHFTFHRVRYAVQVTPPPVVLQHKRFGTVTSHREGDSETVFDDLGELALDGLESVGRLDLDSEGVLLFTTDGQLIHRLTHPRHQVPRTYLVALARPPKEALVTQALAGSLILNDGHLPKPVSLGCVEDASAHGLEPEQLGWKVVLTEGKYHEVRRLFAALGSHVERLIRIDYAEVDLVEPTSGERMEAGTSRRLGMAEVEALYARVGLEVVRDQVELEVLGAVEED